jgi:hypothetical protein
MKEFELSEDHEFFEPVGQDVLPEDSEDNIHLRRDQIMESIKNRIEEHLKNNRLVEIYLALEFSADNNVSNYINITYYPES